MLNFSSVPSLGSFNSCSPNIANRSFQGLQVGQEMGEEQGKQDRLCSLHRDAAPTQGLAGLGRYPPQADVSGLLGRGQRIFSPLALCPASVPRKLGIPSVFPLRFIHAPHSQQKLDLGSLQTQCLSPQETPVLSMDKCWECGLFSGWPAFCCHHGSSSSVILTL